eukprot:gnl/TRDRNA2_/TRDRNA2_134040_c0_seq1.p1 gnl/TRDRNA2_/TRDRNA2_134040_c0~~gnl/TRDRNA2_/TRDRNA2_134040_c0_seq1.p1  ORF type:complete len:560 (+),score=63.33 gnl/TRDRNA2_/TRDRNA2_134040_c0_seq1:91-1770(+)
MKGNGVPVYRPGDLIEVFSRMPYGLDNGHERLDSVGERWILAPTTVCGTNRPRIGWTERWLPATVVEDLVPSGATNGNSMVRFRWDVKLWFDWASGERLDASDPNMLLDVAQVSRVRPRSNCWALPPLTSGPGAAIPPGGTELQVGGCPVTVSFIVFRWGAVRIPIQYDAHSWGRTEGSTVSARFIQLFFNRAVVPRLGWNYEVITVFVQNADEFAGISESFLASLCRGKHIVSLYFLWPVQGQQAYGDKCPCVACYVDEGPFFDLVQRMEAIGVATRWPHHSQLWRCLACKEWVTTLSIVGKYHVPLTTRLPKSVVLRDPRQAAKTAIAMLWRLQAARRADDSYFGPTHSDWVVGHPEPCVAKLGFSYEGVDVKMVQGEAHLAEGLYMLATQPGYTSDSVHVQQRVHRVDLEARCFVVNGEIVDVLYTRFARIDHGGYVRDYEKAHNAEEARINWFYNDVVAWNKALQQIQVVTRRWNSWLLTQASEMTVSTRIDYMMERVAPGEAEVWTGEIGEQGYSMGGVDPVIVFSAVLDTIGDDVAQAGRAMYAQAYPTLPGR